MRQTKLGNAYALTPTPGRIAKYADAPIPAALDDLAGAEYRAALTEGFGHDDALEIAMDDTAMRGGVRGDHIAQPQRGPRP